MVIGLSKRAWKRRVTADEKVWLNALNQLAEAELVKFIERTREVGYRAALDELNLIIRTESYVKIYSTLVISQGLPYFEYINKQVKSEGIKLVQKKIDPKDQYFLYMREYLDYLTGEQIVTVVNTARKESLEAVKVAVERAMEAGLGEIELIALIEREVRKEWRIRSQFRSQRIARTEVAGLANRASLLGAEQTALPFRKRWESSIDERTRITHVEADGQEVGKNELFIVGGSRMMYPADRRGTAAETINCRCHMTFVLQGEFAE